MNKHRAGLQSESYSKAIEFLWLNPLSAFVVVVAGVVVSMAFPKKN